MQYVKSKIVFYKSNFDVRSRFNKYEKCIKFLHDYQIFQKIEFDFSKIT